MVISTEIILLALAASIAALCLWWLVPRAVRTRKQFPSVAWGWPEVLFSALIASFFLFMGVASAEHPTAKVDLATIGASIAIYAALIFLIIGFLIFRGINPIEAFGLRWRDWGSGLFLVPAALLLALPFIYLAQCVAYQFFGPNTAPQAIVGFLLESTGWTERAAVCVAAVIAAPLTEELVFRGCIYGVVRKYVGRFAAIVGTSVLFALIHGHLPSLPGLFILAIALVLIYEQTASLWAPISLHAAFNGLTILAAIYWPGLAQ